MLNTLTNFGRAAAEKVASLAEWVEDHAGLLTAEEGPLRSPDGKDMNAPAGEDPKACPIIKASRRRVKGAA